VVGGEFVAELGEGKLEFFGESLGIEKGFGEVGEESRDFARGLQMTFGVGGEEGAGLIEGGVVPEAGEGIGEEAVLSGGKKGGVGGEEGEFEMGREIDEEAIAVVLSSEVVAGDLDVEIAVAEGGEEVLGGL
jgi:hypothetical protein